MRRLSIFWAAVLACFGTQALALTPAQRAAASSAPWTPYSLGASLLGAFDAENAATLTIVSGAAQTWRDPITGIQPTQGTAGNRPTYSATGLNNRPALSGNGTSTELLVTAQPYPITTPYEVWALVKQNALAADATVRAMISWPIGGTNLANFARRVSAGSNVAGFNRGTDLVITAPDFSGIHVVRAQWATGTNNEVISLDGVPGTPITSSVTTTAGTKVSLFNQDGQSQFWNGAINSIWITKALTNAQAAQMLTFLKKRGGVP